MENYIALLLLIVPGFFAIGIYNKLSYSAKSESDFSKTIKSLETSVAITILNLICISVIGLHALDGFSGFSNAFNSIDFLMFYSIITIINSIAASLLMDLFSPACFRLINALRKSSGKNTLLNVPSLSCLLCDGKKHLIAIERQGAIIEPPGLIDVIDTDDGEVKSFSIVSQEEFQGIDFSGIDILRRYCNIWCDDRVVVEYDINGILPEQLRSTRILEIGFAIVLLVIPFGFGLLFKFLF